MSALPSGPAARVTPTSNLTPLLLCPAFGCSHAAQVPGVLGNQQAVGGEIGCPNCGEPMMLVHYAVTMDKADWGRLSFRAVPMRAELRR